MKRLVAAWLVIVVAGCTIGVTQDYDTSIEFAQLRTYAWQPETSRTRDNPLANNNLVDERVRRAVDAELSKKSYKKVDLARADFTVMYHYAIQDRIDLDSGRSSIGVGVGSGSRGSFGGIGIGIGLGDRTYEQDTLAIDVIDPKSGKLIWRGIAKRQYTPKSNPRELTERFNETVQAILAKFPPK
ncbi:MAG TPA: DUF4136 domain-containing protein [Burkholderiales bacterium]|nr:DUF4136 domain-containing protein [Burkholderiales bacterium]